MPERYGNEGEPEAGLLRSGREEATVRNGREDATGHAPEKLGDQGEADTAIAPAERGKDRKPSSAPTGHEEDPKIALERYGHGGDLETASALYGLPADAFLDYSSNMNPWGPPETAKAAMLRAWERVGAYPDPTARRLRAALAEKHGVPEEAIWVGNGAAEAIDLAMRVARPTVAAVVAPGFKEYETAVAHAGGQTTPLYVTAEDGFALRPEAVREAGKTADVIALGHPNNPTGRLIEPETAEAALESFRTVLIDEAFLDFHPEEERDTWVRRAAETPGLFVTRSLTKFYSIPGLRLGYVVAHPDAIARIRGLAVPWSANGIALEVGLAVLADAAFAAKTLDWLPEERERMAAGLRAIGFEPFPSDANFMLVRLPRKREEGASGEAAPRLRAGGAQTALGRQGILIRNAATFRGLDDTYVRLAVKRREDNDRVLDALRAWADAEREALA